MEQSRCTGQELLQSCWRCLVRLLRRSRPRVTGHCGPSVASQPACVQVPCGLRTVALLLTHGVGLELVRARTCFLELSALLSSCCVPCRRPSLLASPPPPRQQPSTLRCRVVTTNATSREEAAKGSRRGLFTCERSPSPTHRRWTHLPPSKCCCASKCFE